MAKGIPSMGRDPDGKAKMINVDEHGNVKVQLSGNLVEVARLLFSQTDTEVVGRDMLYYGDFRRGTTDLRVMTPIDYRCFKHKAIYITNNTDVPIHIWKCRLYASIVKGAPLLTEVLIGKTIEVGAVGLISSREYLDLSEPFLGIVLVLRQFAGGLSPATTGSITLHWFGGN